jgi:hypothetical protein
MLAADTVSVEDCVGNELGSFAAFSPEVIAGVLHDDHTSPLIKNAVR